MLHQYHIDFSQLSPDERQALIDRIERFSFIGVQLEQGFQSGAFFIDEDFDLGLLKIPDCCHLFRVM
jgi:hypothetical protein